MSLIALLPAAALAAQVPPPAVPPPALPAEVRAVLTAAIASGDRQAVETVARYAARAFPAAEGEIRTLEQGFQTELAARDARAAAAHREQIATAGPLELWAGQVEFGGSRATGSTDSLGLYVALAAHREGADWTHQLAARAEIQDTNGTRTAERIGASWQARRREGPRLYLFGLAQYERDPFIGFDNRYTAGIGAGYSVVDRPNLHLELEGGPAFRQTDPRTRDDFSALAARASLAFRWKLSPTLEFKQNGSFYLESDNGTGQALSALDAAVLGPLRVRLSYELRFERDILRDVRSLDTTSRATLVYGF